MIADILHGHFGQGETQWEFHNMFRQRKNMVPWNFGAKAAHARHEPRLLSDNGPSYMVGELAEYIEAHKMIHVLGAPFRKCGQAPTLASNLGELHPSGKLLPARGPGSPDRGVCRVLQSEALSRMLEQH